MPLCVSGCPGRAEAEDSARPRCACTQCRKWLPAAEVRWAGGVICSWSSVLWGEIIRRKDHSEPLNASSGRFCGVWAVTLWFCHLWWLFGPKEARNLRDPSRTFVGNHKPSGNLRDPSSSFEDLRGTPAKVSGNLRDSSSSFGGLQDKPSRNLRDPSSSFEVLRKGQKEVLRPKWENPSEIGRYSPSGHNSPRIPR